MDLGQRRSAGRSAGKAEAVGRAGNGEGEQADMVKVYLKKIDGDSGEEEKISHSRQSEAARLLLTQALDERIPGRTGELRLGKDEAGKPFLPEYPQIYISISHSGSFAVCAVGDAPVGVDIQVWKKGVSLEKVGRKLHPEERRALSEAKEEEKIKLFYDIWVRKESFLKAVGTGLLLPLDSFLAADRVIQDVKGEEYFIRQYRMEEGCSLAVCAAEPSFASEAFRR